MRRLSLFAYIVLFALVMPVFAQKEPVPARKPLRFWVERLSHKDPKIRKRAVKFLESEAGGFMTSLRLELGYIVPNIAGVTTKVKTKKELVVFRQEAKPLIPELLESLKSTDENVVDAASLMLLAMGPDGRTSSPYLERIVLDKKTAYITRISALHSLLFITPEDQPVGPIFVKLLNTLPDEALQLLAGGNQDTISEYKGKQSVSSFRGSFIIAASIHTCFFPLVLSGHTKCEVPYLVKVASGDYPPSVRALAIGILGSMTFDAKSSVPALRKLLKDEDRFIGYWAANALIQIEPDPKLVPVIVEALKLNGKEREEYEKEMHEYFEQHEKDRQLFQEFGSDSLAYLVHQLTYRNGFHRRRAIHNLGQIGPGAKSVVPELWKLLKDPDVDTRRMAAEAIKQIETEVVRSNGK